MKLNDGKLHQMVFSGGKLYIDGVVCEQDLTIVFQTYEDKTEETGGSVLSVSVHDTVKTKDIGPGQG